MGNFTIDMLLTSCDEETERLEGLLNAEEASRVVFTRFMPNLTQFLAEYPCQNGLRRLYKEATIYLCPIAFNGILTITFHFSREIIVADVKAALANAREEMGLTSLSLMEMKDSLARHPGEDDFWKEKIEKLEKEYKELEEGRLNLQREKHSLFMALHEAFPTFKLIVDYADPEIFE